MPNTKSAKKRLRQNHARRDANRSRRSALRSQIRKVREAVAEGNLELADKEFVEAARKLDKAGARRLVHPNTAGRLKSRLSKLIRTAKTAAA